MNGLPNIPPPSKKNQPDPLSTTQPGTAPVPPQPNRPGMKTEKANPIDTLKSLDEPSVGDSAPVPPQPKRPGDKTDKTTLGDRPKSSLNAKGPFSGDVGGSAPVPPQPKPPGGERQTDPFSPEYEVHQYGPTNPHARENLAIAIEVMDKMMKSPTGQCFEPSKFSAQQLRDAYDQTKAKYLGTGAVQGGSVTPDKGGVTVQEMERKTQLFFLNLERLHKEPGLFSLVGQITHANDPAALNKDLDNAQMVTGFTAISGKGVGEGGPEGPLKGRNNPTVKPPDPVPTRPPTAPPLDRQVRQRPPRSRR